MVLKITMIDPSLQNSLTMMSWDIFLKNSSPLEKNIRISNGSLLLVIRYSRIFSTDNFSLDTKNFGVQIDWIKREISQDLNKNLLKHGDPGSTVSSRNSLITGWLLLATPCLELLDLRLEAW